MGGCQEGVCTGSRAAEEKAWESRLCFEHHIRRTQASGCRFYFKLFHNYGTHGIMNRLWISTSCFREFISCVYTERVRE